jgi:hypothetical protein
LAVAEPVQPLEPMVQKAAILFSALLPQQAAGQARSTKLPLQVKAMAALVAVLVDQILPVLPGQVIHHQQTRLKETTGQTVLLL